MDSSSRCRPATSTNTGRCRPAPRPYFREHGATRTVECWGDDLPDGKLTDMRRAVHAEDGGTVVFSWIVWPSRAARDEGSRKVMADPRMAMGSDMPFDGKRMIYGGFAPLFDSRRLGPTTAPSPRSAAAGQHRRPP